MIVAWPHGDTVLEARRRGIGERVLVHRREQTIDRQAADLNHGLEVSRHRIRHRRGPRVPGAGSAWEVLEVSEDVLRLERLLIENHLLDLTEKWLPWHRGIDTGVGVLIRCTDQEECAVRRRVEADGDRF